MKRFVKEAILVLISVTPLVFMQQIWDDLPDTIPTHFDLSGQADGWSDKSSLPFLIGGIGLGMYLMMLVIPYIDPKKRLEEMDGKYFSLRLIMAVFFAAIGIFIIYSAQQGELAGTKFLFLLMGGMFAMLGNYFQAVRPNYFVGIRTPWTLQSEHVWKVTHRVGGRLWMIGGLLIMIASLLVDDTNIRAFIFGTILVIMIAVPVLVSFMEFRKETKDH
jgi:uncharacterized membrane protein